MNRERTEATMIDREALAAALSDNAVELSELVMPESRRKWLRVVLAAARERLAQLPEKCGTCEGGDIDTGCSVCHGSGKLYPAELVERISRIADCTRNQAVAVLDALNGETE